MLSRRAFLDNEKKPRKCSRACEGRLTTATEWYRRQTGVYADGIPTDDEIKEFLAEEAATLNHWPVAPNRFDFSLQRA